LVIYRNINNDWNLWKKENSISLPAIGWSAAGLVARSVPYSRSIANRTRAAIRPDNGGKLEEIYTNESGQKAKKN